jgi:hypothetical protein
VGWSATSEAGRLDGLRLEVQKWKVTPLEVTSVFSSWFTDRALFPEASVEFDCGLLMRDIDHLWHAAGDLRVAP